MLEAIKMNNDKTDTKIIDFPTNKVLENYLKKFIISKEDFDYNMILNEDDKVILQKYYVDSYNHAETLVMDDEYVGKSFDNLDKISKVLKNKHKN